MVTYYVLYDARANMFARAGKGKGWTYTLNLAKHFTSSWSAGNYRKTLPDSEGVMIKKIQRY